MNGVCNMSSITIDLDQGLAWSERLAQFRVELEQISAYIKEDEQVGTSVVENESTISYTKEDRSISFSHSEWG
jgi:hypothetical protein